MKKKRQQNQFHRSQIGRAQRYIRINLDTDLTLKDIARESGLIAFTQIFKQLAEDKVQLRPEFCIENYLNDPKEIPEDKLLTELLVPVV